MAATLLRKSPRGGVAAARRTSRTRRHFRLRKKISGTPARPRLVVTRSARHIYAQVVDDLAGRTLAAASTLDPSIRGDSDGDKTTRARRVGELLASRAKDAGVGTVVFDRGGNSYHGRIAALADAARKGGLEF
ncbi:MAG: 50S ribosomal protein L18 [Nocardioides sp.]